MYRDFQFVYASENGINDEYENKVVGTDRGGRIENDKTVASEESNIVFEELYVCDEACRGRKNVRGKNASLIFIKEVIFAEIE